MGKVDIDIRRKAPNVFNNEKDIKLSGLDGSDIRDALRKMGDSPDFGGHYIKPGGPHWYDDIPDGPFNPYAEECGFHDYYEQYNDDFLICGMEGDDDSFTIRYCDFDLGFNESFYICKSNNCRTMRKR